MVKDTMIAQAFDLGKYGRDPNFGHGLPNAYKAITGTPIPEFEAIDVTIFATILVSIILFSTRARIVKKSTSFPHHTYVQNMFHIHLNSTQKNLD